MSRNTATALGAVALVGVTFLPGVAEAACSSPAGVAGEMRYNGSTYMMCDGAVWYDMGLASGLDGISDVNTSSPARTSEVRVRPRRGRPCACGVRESG